MCDHLKLSMVRVEDEELIQPHRGDQAGAGAAAFGDLITENALA